MAHTIFFWQLRDSATGARILGNCIISHIDSKELKRLVVCMDVFFTTLRISVLISCCLKEHNAIESYSDALYKMCLY